MDCGAASWRDALFSVVMRYGSQGRSEEGDRGKGGREQHFSKKSFQVEESRNTL